MPSHIDIYTPVSVFYYYVFHFYCLPAYFSYSVVLRVLILFLINKVQTYHVMSALPGEDVRPEPENRSHRPDSSAYSEYHQVPPNGRCPGWRLPPRECQDFQSGPLLTRDTIACLESTGRRV